MSTQDDLPPLPGDIDPGCGMPVAWLIIALVGVCGGAGLVGFQAYGSESAGINAAQLAAFPVGFAATGAIVGFITHFTVKKSPGLRAGLPVGCGCLGGLAAIAAVAVFFTAIFPGL